MKYVDSGSGKIPLITLIAILTISLIVNLPGLAISPLLGKLKDVFPNDTELESQLLVVLPNFVIIPFILGAGKLCNLKNQMFVLALGLVIYILSGIMFLFADSMIELILLSCLLGIGCGLCIPLAASLISQNFVGKARTRFLGMKSGLSNFTVIFATLFVGWIASIGWHWAFLVYLIPVIPLCLMPFLTRSYIDKHKIVDPSKLPEPLKEPATPETKSDGSPNVHQVPPHPNFHFQGHQAIMLLLGVIGLYITMTYTTMAFSNFLPFTMKHYSLSSGDVGIATAMFYLAATISGFGLTRIIRTLKTKTPYIALGLCVLGLYLCGFIHHYIVYMISIFIIGLGYGVMQPIIYDKTAYIAPNQEKSTEYFAYTLTGNYIAIALVPFVVDMFARIFGSTTINFPYIFNASILLAVLCIGFFKCKSFVFNMAGISELKKDESKAN